MFKAIVIDDEEMARVLLQGLLSEVASDIEVVDSCKDLPSGVKSIRKHKPDLVFLDIEMPGHSGLELLDFFDENEVDFSIIFVTAYNRYAIQAFKLSAVDYLLKPIEIEDLVQALDLFRKNQHRKHENLEILKHNLKSSNSKKVALHTLGSISFVETNEILFLQGEGSYTKIFLKNGKNITLSKGLKHFEVTLADMPEFFRCHKSYIVNLQHISDYVKSDGGYLIIDKEYHIGVSSDKVDELLRKIM